MRLTPEMVGERSRHVLDAFLIPIQVPIIAIFTKMDGLEQRAFNKLAMDGVFDKEKVTAEAKATFERNYLEPLQAVKYKPRYTVQLRGMLLTSTAPATSSTVLHPDMHKEGTDCFDLIARTSEALDSKTLKLFCLSILRSDVEFCIKDIINE